MPKYTGAHRAPRRLALPRRSAGPGPRARAVLAVLLVVAGVTLLGGSPSVARSAS
ncbi:MAG: hypothetical protein QOK10_970 [Pseudonocardiales bacterium]|jgi:hypothetical protein|nr:hypothetical protein [Pseudonocardiales bacterium]